jgi:hypothetical protein
VNNGEKKGRSANADLGLHNFNELPRPIIIVADEGQEPESAGPERWALGRSPNRYGTLLPQTSENASYAELVIP